MNKALSATLVLICIHLTCLDSNFAQSTSKTNNPSADYSTELFFNSAIKQQSRLYNGAAFYDYPTVVEGSANFQDLNTFSTGTVVYQDFRFENVPLMYDIYQDKLISVLGKYNKYSLVSEKVSDFYLNDHHFKYIKVIDTTISVIRPGFYDLIHDGKSKIYVRRTKNMQFSLQNKVVTYYFVPKTSYYIERDQKYSTINGEKSFLSFFKDKKPELKKLLKEKKIKFRKQPDEAMVLLASYYESLTN
ncbi:hypothetical protein [Pedobacter insulae]|uniref:GLPGLI family protein n=1 Tax=Pedobacter insulae TaxID=414048 RepID=A0A1I2XEX8_9SPHI|nr:hypothetical protein [Pedobacter insulae]SFH11985.1 hypothetical protein SAMN04489864_105194 [Pedobacter insulae]